MGEKLKKIIWYMITVLCGFAGMVVLFRITVQSVRSADAYKVILSASYGMVLALRYPVLCAMIIFFAVFGVIGYVCIGRNGAMEIRMNHQGKAEIIVYGVLQLCLLVLMVFGSGVYHAVQIFATVLLSVSLYMCVVWAGNIHRFVKMTA